MKQYKYNNDMHNISILNTLLYDFNNNYINCNNYYYRGQFELLHNNDNNTTIFNTVLSIVSITNIFHFDIYDNYEDFFFSCIKNAK